jgi:hypothetical protein
MTSRTTNTKPSKPPTAHSILRFKVLYNELFTPPVTILIPRGPRIDITIQPRSRRRIPSIWPIARIHLLSERTGHNLPPRTFSHLILQPKRNSPGTLRGARLTPWQNRRGAC